VFFNGETMPGECHRADTGAYVPKISIKAPVSPTEATYALN
jgi:hypothetical protein